MNQHYGRKTNTNLNRLGFFLLAQIPLSRQVGFSGNSLIHTL